jgi:5'-nucleotidase
VISGMNAGANVGINVIYSGTVGAAVEGAFLGIPSIAVSLHLGDRTRTNFARAAQIARTAIDRILEHPLDAHRVMTVNVPRTESPDAPMPPIRVVKMNVAAGIDGYERRTTPDGRAYYWPDGNGMEFVHTAEGSDVEALFERAVTVTPLWYDLSEHATLASWRARLER